MRNENHRCGNCIYATKVEPIGPVSDVTQKLFQCQRFPPTSLGMTQQGAMFGWPVMKSDQYCGEFAPANGESDG